MSKKNFISYVLCSFDSFNFGAEFKEGTYVGEAKGYRGEIKSRSKNF